MNGLGSLAGLMPYGNANDIVLEMVRPSTFLSLDLPSKSRRPSGMSYSAEVDMIAQAHAMGFLTTPYAFNGEEARAMARAGADIVVAHMGLTTGGAIGASRSGLGSKTIDDCVELCVEIRDAVREVRGKDCLVLVHGGPVEGAKEAAEVISRVEGLHGFYGASSVERLPVEAAIRGTVEELKGVKLYGVS